MKDLLDVLVAQKVIIDDWRIFSHKAQENPFEFSHVAGWYKCLRVNIVEIAIEIVVALLELILFPLNDKEA